MTALNKPLARVSNSRLDGSYGPDRNKRLIVTLIPGDGDKVPDLIKLKPFKTRRAESIALADVYRYALRCRVNLQVLSRARDRKARKAERLARLRRERAERRLFAAGSCSQGI